MELVILFLLFDDFPLLVGDLLGCRMNEVVGMEKQSGEISTDSGVESELKGNHTQKHREKEHDQWRELSPVHHEKAPRTYGRHRAAELVVDPLIKPRVRGQLLWGLLGKSDQSHKQRDGKKDNDLGDDPQDARDTYRICAMAGTTHQNYGDEDRNPDQGQDIVDHSSRHDARRRRRAVHQIGAEAHHGEADRGRGHRQSPQQSRVMSISEKTGRRVAG